MEIINSINSVTTFFEGDGGRKNAAFLRLGAIRQIAVFGIHHSSPSLNLLVCPVHAYYHVYIYPTDKMNELNGAIQPDIHYFENSRLSDKIKIAMDLLGR